MSIIGKIKYILEKSHKKDLLKLSVLIVIGMIFEIAGLGLILPTISTISDPQSLYKIPSLRNILERFGNPTSEALIIAGMLGLTIFYVFKTIYLTFLNWKQATFSSKFTAHISKRLYNGYLNMPYYNHLEKNSSILIRNIQNEVSIFTTLSQNIIFLTSEISVIIGIIILLITIEPLGALLTIILLTLIIFFFYKISRKKIRIWGEERQYFSGIISQNLMQGLGGIKDIKLIGKEDYFLNEYNQINNKIANINSKINTIDQLPRLLLEFIAVAALASLITIMVLLNNSITSIIPVLGIFVAAAFRMIPSINKIMYASQRLVYSMPVIDLLYNEFLQFNKFTIKRTIHENIEFNNSISLSNLSFRYKDSNNYVFENINLNITIGQSIGIIGESGSGKSTLIDILLGLLTPISGKFFVDNTEINENNISGWQNIVAYVPQTIYLTDDTLRNNIAFGLSEDEIDDNLVMDAIINAQLNDLLTTLPEGIKTKLGERGVRLSGGQRQRIGIARALYRNTKILVFDEATSALDTNTENEVMRAINNLRGYKTLILVAHRLSTLSNCDNIYKLDHHGLNQTQIENVDK
jgi:ABC-type multidrug transport system fused ATPase/permease subunit